MQNTIQMIKTLLFLILALLTGCVSKPLDDKGLKEIASFPIGGAIEISQVTKDSALRNIIIRNFNSITATSDMKMYAIAPRDSVYNWEKADSLVDFSQRNDLRLFGHTLVWHSGTPRWVFQKASQDSVWLSNFLKIYIQDYVGRYKGKVAAWDVVNEGLDTQGGAYRETLWYNKLGKEYIANAFRYAHEADPDADLFYNDFNLERDTAKLNGVLRMIEELKADEVPITGLGVQMHLRMDIPEKLIRESVRKMAATGLKIHFSELDIIFNTHDDSRGGGEQIYSEVTSEMLEQQAQKYEIVAKIYREEVPKEQQFGITFWDFTDRDTWINPFFGLNDWPTIFNKELKPKPAYYGFKKGLAE